MLTRTLAAAALLALIAGSTSARAETDFDTTVATEIGSDAQDRLLIVNGNSGRVIYDDGRNDLFCVTRKVVAGYDWYGRPVFKRTMKCR